MGFSVITTYAWGHWVSSADFNAIQLVIRYSGVLAMLSLPDLAESASLAAGKNDYRVVYRALFFRTISYFLVLAIALIASSLLKKSLFPGLPLSETWRLLWYMPAAIIPSFISGVYLSSNRARWTAMSRIASAACPPAVIGLLFLLSEQDFSLWFLVLIGVLNSALILPLFNLRKEQSNVRTQGLLRYGVQMNFLRIPEFLLGLEVFILSKTLTPLQLTFFFLADRLFEQAKLFIVNICREGYARYSRCATRYEMLEESKKDFWRWFRRLHVYSLTSIILIPAGMFLWRMEYWPAIALSMGLLMVCFLSTPTTFIRLGLIAMQNKSYVAWHSILFPLTYLPLLYLGGMNFGLWGVFCAHLLSNLVAIGVVLYFWRMEELRVNSDHHYSNPVEGDNV